MFAAADVWEPLLLWSCDEASPQVIIEGRLCPGVRTVERRYVSGGCGTDRRYAPGNICAAAIV